MEHTINDDEKAVLDTVRANETEMIDNRVRMAMVAVTSAELLALFTTPKPLVAAPGAGYALELVSAILALDYESAAYATNGDLSIGDGTTTLSDTIALADFLAKTADTVQVCQALSADQPLAENAGLQLEVATGNPATGDSDIMLKVFYRVHDLAQLGL